MNCDHAKQAIPLYYYGELAPGEEERLEQHVDGCAGCRAELEQHRRMAGALDSRRLEVPAGLLAECRHDLMRAIYREGVPARPAGDAWGSFRDGFAALFDGFSRLRQPAAAVALLSLGFFSARLTPSFKPFLGEGASTQDVVYSSIRSVQPDSAGRVQISLDETRRRLVSGRLADDHIRRLLMAAVREQDNPAVRVESVGLLKAQPVAPDVRQVLVSAALHDPSAAVRLKAVESLKAVAGDPDIRKALAQVLVSDENPGVRIRTIDMLIEHRDDSMVGVLQDVVQKENNSYVRLQCEKALKEMNASLGTF